MKSNISFHHKERGWERLHMINWICSMKGFDQVEDFESKIIRSSKLRDISVLIQEGTSRIFDTTHNFDNNNQRTFIRNSFLVLFLDTLLNWHYLTHSSFHNFHKTWNLWTYEIFAYQSRVGIFLRSLKLNRGIWIATSFMFLPVYVSWANGCKSKVALANKSPLSDLSGERVSSSVRAAVENMEYILQYKQYYCLSIVALLYTLGRIAIRDTILYLQSQIVCLTYGVGIVQSPFIFLLFSLFPLSHFLFPCRLFSLFLRLFGHLSWLPFRFQSF